MALKFCQGKVTHKKIWTEGLFTIRVAVEGVREFEPGQFLQVGIDRGTEKHLHRPYSVASPHGPEIEFFIVLVEDGELTPHLWKMEVGDSIDVAERAAGSFTLKKTPDAENLWLVATGTGLAPYIAMLRTTTPWDRFKKIVVVHGVRHGADLGYQEEFAEYAKSHPEQFVYVPTLTRDESDGALRGRIPQLLDDGNLERAAGCEIAANNCSIMLCGNPAMLDEMEEKLGTRGLKKHKTKDPGQIVLERYW